MVALEAAQRDEVICGLVLVATTGRPLGNVLKDQLRANPASAPLLNQANAAMDWIAAGKRVVEKGLPSPLAPLFRPAIQGFLISTFALDPAELVSNVRKPAVIIQGERGIQVDVTDAQAVRVAAPAAALALLPNTNDLPKQVMSGHWGAKVATYAGPSLPLAPNVTQTIALLVMNPRQS